MSLSLPARAQTRMHRCLMALVLGLLMPMAVAVRGAVPAILEGPVPHTAFAGENHSFSVRVSGSEPLSYVWRRDDVGLPGQTNATLLLTNLQSSDAGWYLVVITNAEGSMTSAPVRLSVRAADAPRYPPPPQGWAYLFEGNAAGNGLEDALDGEWNRFNGLDSWDGLGRGPGNGQPGGLEATQGWLTLEDAVAVTGSGADNRRFYFTHDLGLEGGRVTNASTLLNDGVTLTFRARLTPPTDPLLELTNAPNGWLNAGDGKGLFGLRQSGDSGMIISFSLHNAVEDTGAASTFSFGRSGLHMNNLNGNVRTSFVDPGEPGSLNVLPLDPTVFHEFWVTIQGNGPESGTHTVTVYRDGSRTGAVFQVTAGLGSDLPFTNYLALGMGSTPQRGAVDVDFFGYAAGVNLPPDFDEPVGWVWQPDNATRWLGEYAVFRAGVTGTPPYRFQWFRDGTPIPGGTNAALVFGPMAASDDGALFTVVVSNDYNAITSAPPARLSLLQPPVLLVQPRSLTVTNGDPALLQVEVQSSQPAAYQWRRNHSEVPGATNASLLLPAASPADAGSFDVVVSNQAGSVTSAPAALLVRTLDFGDAPWPYPVMRSAQGASHVIWPGLHLGSAPDAEIDGQPAADALGDDQAGAADEDGVRWLGPVRVGQMAALEVVASTNGMLDAWVDWNGDGSWGESMDCILAAQPLQPGTNLLSIPVPAAARPGTTIGRFRFSTAGGLSSTGPAADGEVEDHRLSIEPVAALAATCTAWPQPVAVGSNLTLVIRLANTGPSAATGVTITNHLPAGATLVSSQVTSGSCELEIGHLRCQMGTLPPGSTGVVEIVLLPAGSGPLTNRVVVTAAEYDPDPADNDATLVVSVLEPPRILATPLNITVTNGAAVVFNVLAAGAPPLEYEWLRDGSVIAGATNATWQVPAAGPADEGEYIVRVRNGVGAVVSVPARLTVLVPPYIVRSPFGVTNLAGATSELAVEAAGTPPLLYQWYFQGAEVLTGATNATLVLSNAQPAQAGDYLVVVRSSSGVVTSALARLALIAMDFGDAPDPPYPSSLGRDGARHRIQTGIHLGATVNFEPEGGVREDSDDDGVEFLDPVRVGQEVRLRVVASVPGRLDAWLDADGDGQWQPETEGILAGTLLTAGTNDLVFVVPRGALPGRSQALFRFSLAGGLNPLGEAPEGEVESYPVDILPVSDLAVRVASPVTLAAVGVEASLVFEVTNHGPSTAAAVVFSNALPTGLVLLQSQSSRGGCAAQDGGVSCALGTLGPGERASVNLRVQAVTPGLLTNLAGVGSQSFEPSSADNVTVLTVDALVPPSIMQPPVDRVVIQGASLTLTVGAEGSRLRYQWLFGSDPLPGATNAFLSLSTVSTNDVGSYSVVVSNEVGSVRSSPARLTVLTPPFLVTPPREVAVLPGNAAVFTVEAGGTSPLQFQWQRDGQDLPGQTNAVCLLSAPQFGDAGFYRVRVSNAAGEVWSEAVRLILLVAPYLEAPPPDATFFAGAPASLVVAAGGTAPLTYQWWRAGVGPLFGQTNATLSLTNVQSASTGEYFVVVTNLGGAVTSALARVVVIAADFGDAPETWGFPTRLAFQGAWHQVVPGVQLGARLDFEPDGQPDARAEGDDRGDASDEDGIVFLTPFLVGQPVEIELAASTNGFVDAWVDFGADGSWMDSADQILSSAPVVAGRNRLVFQVPLAAVVTNTYSRFRFSRQGGLPPHGPAPDGEVEDYAVRVHPAVNLGVTMVDGPDPAPIGGGIILTQRITNQGPSTATAVWLTNLLSSRARILSVSASQGDCSNGVEGVICDLGTLAPGAMATVALEVSFDRAGRYVTRATVSAAENEVQRADNAAEETTAVVAPASATVNSNPVVLVDAPQDGIGSASPYPSTIAVSGLTGTVQRVEVILRELVHPYPADLDLLLVGPGGQTCLLMSDVGGGTPVSYVTLRIDDGADVPFPSSGLLFNRPYRPTNLGSVPDIFPAPAPPGPHGAALSVFAGTNPNGVWSLYAVDDSPSDSGSLASGWELVIATADPMADVSVGFAGGGEAFGVNSNVFCPVVISNHGPSAVCGVWLTNWIPAGLQFVSATLPDGACFHQGTQVACWLPSLAPLTSATAMLVLQPVTTGTYSNRASVVGGDVDFEPGNNIASCLIRVLPVNDLRCMAAPSTNRLVLGNALRLRVTADNLGPAPATQCVLSSPLPAGVLLLSTTASQGSCATVDGMVRCELGTLPAGSSAAVELVLQPDQVGVLTQEFSVASAEIDTHGIDNVTTVVTPVQVAADLSLTLAAPPGPVAATSNQTHTVTLLNQGPSMAAGVTAELRLSQEIQALVVAASQGGCVATGGVVSCTLGSLPAGQAAVITLRFAVQEPVLLTNVAAVSSSSFDFDTADNLASATVPILAPPVIEVPPVDSRYFPGATARLSLIATGHAPLRYQWSRDGQAVPGATNAVLQIPGFGPETAGLYVARVENQVGAVDSQPATLRVAQLPTISDVPDSRVDEDRELTLPFTVGDAETPAALLQVAVSCSNTNLFPPDGIRLQGTASAREIALRPATNAFGEATLTLTVTDEEGGTATDAFRVIVDAVNDAPTLDPIANQDLRVDPGQRWVYLTGITSGPANETANPTLSAVSANPAAIPHPSLQHTPGATEGWLSFTPAPGATGVVALTVTVDDGAASNRFFSRSFTVSLQPSNYAPTILPIAQIVSPEDVPVVVPVALVDVETPPDQLVLTCSCSDTNLIPLAGLALSGGGAVRQLRVTPATNASGSVTVSLTVTDGGGLTARRDFRLTIQPVNDPPWVAGWLAFTVAEDSISTPQPFVIGDAESGPDTLLLAVRSSNPLLLPDGRVTVGGSGANRTLSVTPLPDQFGSSWITLILTDPSGLTNEESVLITVSPRNDPPTLDPVPPVTVDESTGLHLVSLTGITPGPSNELQALTLTATSSNPSLVPPPTLVHSQGQSTAQLFFAPTPGMFGTATLTVTVDDGGETNRITQQSFVVTVRPVNDPPVIGFIPAMTTRANTPIEIPFTLVDDLTPAGDLTLSAQAAEQGLLATGGLVFGGTGTNRLLLLTPGTNQTGATWITLSALDAGGLVSTRTFLLTIDPGNRPPGISPVASQAMDEDGGTLVVAFWVTDVETPVSNLVVTATCSDSWLVPEHNLTLTGSGTNRTLRILPFTNAFGTATITLAVRDGSLSSASTSFQLTVRSVNDAPQLGPLPDLVADQDTVLGVPLAVSDPETAVADLLVTASASDTNLLQAAGIEPAGTGGTRTLLLVPRLGSSGSCVVTVRVTDGSGGSTQGSFNLTVRPGVPAAPWIAVEPLNQAGLIDGTVTLTVEALGLAPLGYRWTFQGQTLPGATNTSLTLTNLQLANAGNYQAIVTNLYGGATSRVAVVSVFPPSLAPALSGLPAVTNVNEDTWLSVPFTVSDPDTPVFRLVLGVVSTNPAVVAATNVFLEGSGTNRTLLILPNTNAFGTTLLSVTASDGSGTVTNSVLLAVNPVNDPPTLDAIPDVLVDGFGNPPAQTLTLNGISTGATNETQSLQILLTSDNPAFVTPLTANYTGLGSTGIITFDSINKASGSAIMTVTVNDGGASNQVISRSFTAYYYLSQTPPVISSIPAQTMNEDGSAGPIAFTVGDATTPSANLTVQAFSSNPALLPTSGILFGGSGSNRTVTLRPEPDRFGTSTVRIAVLDGGFAFAATTFIVTVNSVNDLPTLAPPGPQALPWNSIAAPRLFQVTDKETPSDRLTVTASSSDTNLVPLAGILLGGYGTNRAVSVVPASNRTGTATITLTTRDAGGGAASNSFVVTVFATNEAPVVTAPASVQWDEDTTVGPVTITLADDLTPPQDLVLTVASTNTSLLPASGLQLRGTGATRTLTLIPSTNSYGQSLITLTATDAGGRSAVHRTLAVVRPVNDPPTLAPLPPLTLTAGSIARTVPFSGVGSGAPGENQYLLVAANSDNPAVVPDPIVSYTSPGAGGTLTLLPVAVGTATIAVSVNDGGPANPVTTRPLTVTVVPPPTLSDLPDVSIPEDSTSAPILFSVLGLQTAPEGLVITVSCSNTNLLPLSRILLGGTGTNRSLVLQPAPDQFGSCRVTVQFTDVEGYTGTKSFLVAVEPVNDPPALSALADLTLLEDSGPQNVPLTGIRAGPTNEAQVLSVTATSSRPDLIPHPTVSYQSPQSTGALSFQPVTNAFGTATVSVVIFDGAASLGSVTQSFRITVLDRNDPPTLSPMTDRTTSEDLPVLVGFVVSDLETAPDELLITAFSSDPVLLPPSSLRLFGTNGDRGLWIQPATNQTGSVTITVTVRDAAGATNSAQFQLTVTPVDDPLVVIAPPAQTTAEDTATPPLTFTLWDPDSPVSGFGVRALSSNPALLPPSGIRLDGTGSNRTIQLFPATNQSGSAVITLVASNGMGLESSSSFVLSVTPVEDAPVISLIPDITLDENTVSPPIPFVVGDVETPSANLNVSAASSNPFLLPAAQIVWSGVGSNRTFRLAPLANRSGQAAITVVVTDGGGLSAYRTFTATVVGLPAPPTILTNPVGATVSFGTAVAFSVTAGGTGPLLYQWLRDGVPLAGATNRVLVLPSALPADAGVYRVQVRNAAGMATSAAALLEVQGQLTAPTILSVTTAGGSVQITFTSSPNTRCLVEYRAEAEAGPWSVLTTVTGTGGNLTVVDSLSPARRFYRVREE